MGNAGNPNKLLSIPHNVWVLGIASLLTDTSSEMIHAVLPLFLVNVLGSNLTTVGFIEGLGESIAASTKLFSGALSDYLAKRKLLVVCGYGLSTITKILFPLAQNSWWVLSARVGDRIGKGIRGAPRDALVADSVSAEQRGAAFGMRQALDTVGACLGPAIALVLMFVSAADYRLIFWCALVPAVVAVFLLLFGIVEKKTDKVIASENPLKLDRLKKMGGKFWTLVVVVLVFNLGNSSDAFLLLRMKQMGLSSELVPASLIVMNITYVLTAYPFGWLSDKLGRSGLLLGGMLIYSGVYAGFAFSSALWHLWIFLALYGIYLGLSQGVMLAMVADTVPTAQRGSAFGFINLATGITMLPASLIAGLAWDRISPSAPFIFASFCSLLAAALLYLGVKKESDPERII